MTRSETAVSAPIDKVAYSLYTGAVVSVVVWGLRNYAHTDIPPEVSAALTVLLSGIVGYFTPLRSHEVKP
jgi:predicted RNase H-related nuclease YkuK (DUF458 family)